MTKWEYCSILWYVNTEGPELTDSLRKGSIQSPGRSGSKHIDNLGGAMAALGRDGWEMVSHSVLTLGRRDYATSIFYFKRPLAPD